MPRKLERTTLLSRDTAQAIRYFSFNNCSEFYVRYHTELGMSRATFFRLLQGEYATIENARSIELLAQRLGLSDKKGGSSYLVKSRIVTQFVQIVEQVITRSTVESLNALQEFLGEHKGIMIS